MRIKNLYKNYKNVIPYLFFGVCTTAVNVIVYGVFSHILGFGIMFSTIAAWVVAVVFAYLTNRKWVFNSTANKAISQLKEIFSFFLCRAATGIADWGCMFLFVNVLSCNDLVVKVFSNVIVIVLNYVLSKCIVFKKRRS